MEDVFYNPTQCYQYNDTYNTSQQWLYNPKKLVKVSTKPEQVDYDTSTEIFYQFEQAYQSSVQPPIHSPMQPTIQDWTTMNHYDPAWEPYTNYSYQKYVHVENTSVEAKKDDASAEIGFYNHSQINMHDMKYK